MRSAAWGRPFTFDDPTALAGVAKRLGELYEAKGERAKAAEYYQTVRGSGVLSEVRGSMEER
jgi:hypothetical protein